MAVAAMVTAPAVRATVPIVADEAKPVGFIVWFPEAATRALLVSVRAGYVRPSLAISKYRRG